MFFYEVIVAAGKNPSLDFNRLAGLFNVEDNEVETGAAGSAPGVAGYAGTWTLTKEGRKTIDEHLSQAGVDVIAAVLVPATKDYPMLVVPSGGFGLHRPAAATAARKLAPEAEFGPPRPVVAGRGQYLLFENEGRFVACEIFDYSRDAAENKPYFTDAASLDNYVKAGPAESPADESDRRWSKAMRSLWPWLEEIIPAGKAVTVDAADIEDKYNEFMQAKMGARD